MDQKLLVLSMDAMVEDDIEYLRNKPNFKRLMEHCCQIKKVQTVYPSITYPAHISMITGCRPGKHGVYNNTKFPTEKTYPDWYIDTAEIVKVEDLFAAAKRAGASTASIYWPIMGNNPNIDYNVNEFFFYEQSDCENWDAVLNAFRRMGASSEALPRHL